MTRRALLRIIAVNDVYKLDNLAHLRSLISLCETGKPIPGHPGVKRQRPDKLLVCLAGDFLSPSVLSALDQGQSMVDCLNHLPVSHVCFGNRESDVGAKNVGRRAREFKGKWLNSNMPAFNAVQPLPPFDIITIEPGGVRVGLLGLLSTPNSLRHGKFCGLPVHNVISSATRWTRLLKETESVDVVVPLTHQSIADDQELIKSMPPRTFPVVFGGHEHELHVEDIGDTTLIKTGCDATHAAVVDMELLKGKGVLHKRLSIVDLASLPEDPGMKNRVNQHLEVCNQARNEIVIRSPTPLSSRGMRQEQQSVGTLFATAVRLELAADVCLLNGAPIKGNKDYPDGIVTFLELQEELPFPFKIVVVPMFGADIAKVVHYSRAGEDAQERGFIQVDDLVRTDSDNHAIITHLAGEPIDPEREYNVALPRNMLVNGFGGVKPLEIVRDDLEKRGLLPDEDSYTPALNLVLRHFAKHIWHSLGSFDDLDLNSDGKIAQNELVAAYSHKFGNEPSDAMLGKLMEALDDDSSGFVDRSEYDVFAQQQEEQQQLVDFNLPLALEKKTKEDEVLEDVGR